jgi:hypothetical protein
MQRSIRTELLGIVAEFSQKAGFATLATNELLADLVIRIAEYREEETPLFPEFFISEAGPEVIAALAPAAERVALGSCPIPGAAARILKDAAALACNGWAISVEVHGSTARYGIFRTVDLPVSVDAAESLADPNAELDCVVMLRNCASRCVELLDGRGNHLELSLTTSPPSERPVADAIRELAEAIVADLPSELEILSGYLRRTLTSICQRCHGTLIAVVRNGSDSLPPGFADGVVLDQAIDLAAALQELHLKRSAAALAKLNSYEALMSGMISSDGVTIFTTDAKILAFRVFVRPNEQESMQLETCSVTGGARTRAFELLKLRLHGSLYAAFLRSQDGHTEIRSAES